MNTIRILPDDMLIESAPDETLLQASLRSGIMMEDIKIPRCRIADTRYRPLLADTGSSHCDRVICMCSATARRIGRSVEAVSNCLPTDL